MTTNDDRGVIVVPEGRLDMPPDVQWALYGEVFIRVPDVCRVCGRREPDEHEARSKP